METTPEATQDDTAVPRKSRGAARFVLRGLILLIGAPLILALVLPILLIGQEITAPSWITRQVEAQASQVLAGGRLAFREITVTVARDLHPVVRLRGAEVFDADDLIVARVPEVEVAISPRGLLLEQRVLPQVISLRRAEANVLRRRDGTVAVAFDRTAAGQDGVSVFDLIGGLETALTQPAVEALERVEARGMIVNYDDVRAGRSWTVDGAQFAMDVQPDRTEITGEMTVLSGRSYVTSLTTRLNARRGQAGAELAVHIRDVAAQDISTQSAALSWLSVLRGRVSASLRVSLDDDGALGPLFAVVDIADGVIRPEVSVAPIGFDTAKAYLNYDPTQGEIQFEDLAVAGDWGAVRVQGQALLRDIESGLPQTFLGQFAASDLTFALPGIYDAPMAIEQGNIDFRLRLDPFSVEVGQAFAQLEGTRFTGRGRADISPQGWTIGGDVTAEPMSIAQVLALWPERTATAAQRWVARNVQAGTISHINAAYRSAPGRSPRVSLTHEFSDATVQVMRDLPPIEGGHGTLAIQEDGLGLRLDEGEMRLPDGGALSLAGSTFAIPTLGIENTPAQIQLTLDGTIPDVLAVLDMPPFEVLRKAGRTPDLADGLVRAEGQIDLELRRRTPGDDADIAYAFEATLTDLRSDQIVPEREITSDILALRVDRNLLEIEGDVQLDGVPMQVVWSNPLRTPGSALTADVPLTPATYETFGLALPPGMIAGAGQGRITVDLAPETPPAFTLTSNLQGLALQLPALGWRKPSGAEGEFVITGQLGPVPEISFLSLVANGLDARGRISLRDGGGLERARFERVRIGGWLDAAVDLIGRGAGRPVGVAIRSGSLDLSRANFGASGGDSGPLSVRLEQLQVANGLMLRDFSGQFDGAGGLNGRFTGLLNGRSAVEGILAPFGGRSGVRLQSANAGTTLAAAGLFQTAVGGALDLTLIPTDQPGSFDGTLRVTDLRVQQAPSLATLLDAISVVGLLQQLDGQGLSFSEVDARFRLTPELVTVTQASAIGPGLGLSIDGTFSPGSREMDFQGVISPLYLINGIGSVLTRPGEGLFGFNFTLAGAVGNAQVGVNPLSVLTPGMFREIFRRPAPVVE